MARSYDPLIRAGSMDRAIGLLLHQLIHGIEDAQPDAAPVHVALLENVVGALGGFAAGGGGAGAVGAGAFTLVAPWAAARLLTSAAFVRWLVTPVIRANGVGAHLGRLAGIAAEDPALREPLEQYLAVLRAAPEPTGERDER